MRFSVSSSILPLCLALTACGGGTTGTSGETTGIANSGILTGQFVDAPVANIDYVTGTLSGVTDSRGRFRYRQGEEITFRIGDLALPTITAASLITPLDMSDTGELDDTVINIIRLLQSLDADGNPDNGISITELAKRNATQVNFELAMGSFASSLAVSTLVLNAGLNVSLTGLIPVVEAISHLESQLLALENNTGNLASTPLSDEPSSAWILQPDGANELDTALLVSFTGENTLRVSRLCDVNGVMTDVLLRGTFSLNEKNGVLSTFIVRPASQACEDEGLGKVSMSRLRWRDGRLEAFSSSGQSFVFDWLGQS